MSSDLKNPLVATGCVKCRALSSQLKISHEMIDHLFESVKTLTRIGDPKDESLSLGIIEDMHEKIKKTRADLAAVLDRF